MKKAAIHEAGHAVLYNHYKIGFEKIIIRPNGNPRGCVVPLQEIGNTHSNEIVNGGYVPNEVYKEMNRRKKKDPFICMVGIAAEHIYYVLLPNYHNIGHFPNTSKIEFQEAWSEDFKQIRTLTHGINKDKELTEQEIKEILDKYLNPTTLILLKKWEAVCALAIELLDKRKLLGSEADRIIEANL